jgi:Ca2+-binding EF-hand superfamily protein
MAADMEYLMKELDKDGDGQIDYGEMKTGVCC